MPEPFNKKYSLDNYIYNAVKELPKSYCVLEPNYITLFNYLISFLVLYLFYYDKSIIVIILLAIFRSFLDILDGAIARKCNKYSDLGHKLDKYGDLFYNLFFYSIIYLKIKNKMNLLIILFIIIFIYCFCLINNNLENNILYHITHDNTILISPILFLLFYYLIKYFNNK